MTNIHKQHLYLGPIKCCYLFHTNIFSINLIINAIINLNIIKFYFYYKINYIIYTVMELI